MTPRRASGSSCSPRLVDPVTSVKTMVTVFRASPAMWRVYDAKRALLVGVLVRLRLAEAPGERLEHRPRHPRVLLHERLELPGGEPVAEDVRRSGNARRARPFVDQRDLAEVVAGPERGPDLSTHADRRVALDDDEETRGAGSLSGHRGALREPALLHLPGEQLDVIVGQVREDRDVAKSFLGGRGHAREIIREKVRAGKRRTPRRCKHRSPSTRKSTSSSRGRRRSCPSVSGRSTCTASIRTSASSCPSSPKSSSAGMPGPETSCGIHSRDRARRSSSRTPSVPARPAATCPPSTAC